MQTLPLNVVPPGLELEVSPVGSVPVVGVSVAGVSVDGVSLDGVSVGSSVVGLSEHAPVEYKHIHVGNTLVYTLLSDVLHYTRTVKYIHCIIKVHLYTNVYTF